MKKCIIIGASSGIGQALTELLLQDDFMIGITGRREMLLDAIKEKNPNRVFVKRMDVQDLIPADKDICFLGRKGKFSECGLYSMNLRSESVRDFLKRFQWMYDDAENGIFKQDEWHDSFIFDVVRKHSALNELDWSSHIITGEGHPLINSKWGEYLDHLKGDRKLTGKSHNKDLKVMRNEEYWR